MKRIFKVLSLTLVLLLSLGASAVSADSGPNLMKNGDFASGDFSHWTVFQTMTAGEVTGVTNESIIPGPGGWYSPGFFEFPYASFVVGQKNWEGNALWEGGGISQKITAPAGDWEASVNVTAWRKSDELGVKYSSGPTFELLVDDVVVGTYSIPKFEFTGYSGTITANGTFTCKGSHEVSVRITYWGQPSWAEELVDNIVLSMTSIDAQIDIKPGEAINSINLRSKGVVPVAILGSACFDASTIDPATVSLEGAAASQKGKSGNYGSLEDVNGDGYLDLVVQVNTQDLGLTKGMTNANLTAYTFDGVPISGSDSINIVP